MKQVEKYFFKQGKRWYYKDCWGYICPVTSAAIISYLENRQLATLRASYMLAISLAVFNNIDPIFLPAC